MENDGENVPFDEGLLLNCETVYDLRAVVEAGDGRSDGGAVRTFLAALRVTTG